MRRTVEYEPILLVDPTGVNPSVAGRRTIVRDYENKDDTEGVLSVFTDAARMPSAPPVVTLRSDGSVVNPKDLVLYGSSELNVSYDGISMIEYEVQEVE